MPNIKELKDIELEKVTGGVNMLISEKDKTITVDMLESNYSLSYIFSKAENIIYNLGGIEGYKMCYLTIMPTLKKHKDKITKCVIDTNTFNPTYYIGDTPYTQSEVENW